MHFSASLLPPPPPPFPLLLPILLMDSPFSIVSFVCGPPLPSFCTPTPSLSLIHYTLFLSPILVMFSRSHYSICFPFLSLSFHLPSLYSLLILLMFSLSHHSANIVPISLRLSFHLLSLYSLVSCLCFPSFIILRLPYIFHSDSSLLLFPLPLHYLVYVLLIFSFYILPLPFFSPSLPISKSFIFHFLLCPSLSFPSIPISFFCFLLNPSPSLPLTISLIPLLFPHIFIHFISSCGHSPFQSVHLPYPFNFSILSLSCILFHLYSSLSSPIHFTSSCDLSSSSLCIPDLSLPSHSHSSPSLSFTRPPTHVSLSSPLPVWLPFLYQTYGPLHSLVTLSTYAPNTLTYILLIPLLSPSCFLCMPVL